MTELLFSPEFFGAKEYAFDMKKIKTMLILQMRYDNILL